MRCAAKRLAIGPEAVPRRAPASFASARGPREWDQAEVHMGESYGDRSEERRRPARGVGGSHANAIAVRVLLLAFLATTFSCAIGPARGTDPAAPALVSFATPESMTRLGRSRHRVDFFHLANQFETQGNKAFCGPTSAVIVLNALRIRNERIAKPEDPSSVLPAEIRDRLPKGFDPLYRRYTQNNLFSAEVDRVKTRAEILGLAREPGAKPDAGIQLRQLDALLRASGVDSKLRVVDDTLADDTIRRELAENLATADDYVIVNYLRPAVGQTGGGHVSPLGAYDEESDSFLVLDVNATGQEWAWVPAASLIKAMRTRDVAENRGYLLVKEATP